MTGANNLPVTSNDPDLVPTNCSILQDGNGTAPMASATGTYAAGIPPGRFWGTNLSLDVFNRSGQLISDGSPDGFANTIGVQTGDYSGSDTSSNWFAQAKIPWDARSDEAAYCEVSHL